jgi:hypothetical protein
MRKQGYRHSTIKYCIQALKSIARKASLLQPESAKSYLASAPISEPRKAKLTEDLARFYAYEHQFRNSQGSGTETHGKTTS